MLCCGADSERKMSGRDENQLFIGRLPRGSRTSELEDVFYKYGKMTRCDVKQGIKMAYGFIEYEDKRDAEDALRGEHGRDFNGARIVVEWARGPKDTPGPRGDRNRDDHRDRYRDDDRDRFRERDRDFRRDDRPGQSRSPRHGRRRSFSKSPDRDRRREHSRSRSRSPEGNQRSRS